ncbi:hypothetical protein [Mycolicibacterium parafortuitum]|nr:hypothetical protein [Mycolicibacterium parafortuitum]
MGDILPPATVPPPRSAWPAGALGFAETPVAIPPRLAACYE